MKHCALYTILIVTIFSCTASRENKVEIVRQDHMIPADDDLLIHIREMRSGPSEFAEPLIMVHGGGPGATSSFDLPVPGGSFAADLANMGLTIYMVNVRGWERSTLPPYDLSDSTLVVGSHEEAVEDIRQAVEWVLEREDAKKALLFGWATGGHWVCSYATRYPENVSGIVSLNSLYGVNASWGLRKFFAAAEDSMKFNKTAFFRESAQENLTRTWTRTIPAENKQDWRDPKVEHAYREVSSGFGVDTTVMRVPGGYREESFHMSLGRKYWDARDIAVPVLIIRTELDFWSRPEDLMAIEKDLINSPNPVVLTLPGTHYVFLDRSERGRQKLIEEMIRFLRMESSLKK